MEKDGIEILTQAAKDWNGQEVPDRLLLIVQAVGIKAACGGYTTSGALEVSEAMELIAQKARSISMTQPPLDGRLRTHGS